MRLFKRKSRRPQRFIEKLGHSLVAPVATRLQHVGRPSDKTLKVGAIAAGGLTGLTAGSAGISSLRRRVEGAEDDS